MKINWFSLNEIKPFDKPEEEKTPKIKEGWLNEAKDYYFSLDDKFEGEVKDDSHLLSLFEEYGEAKVVGFKVVE